MLTMEAYLDNSATTRCSEVAKNKMVEALTVDFGNPSSMHMKGVEAEKYVKEATTAIAKTLRCQEKEIVFTSGGTESNNLAIIGTALANQRAGRHIITTSVEHASVKNTMRFLEEEGFEITYLPVDHEGKIKMSALEAVLRPDTIMVSTMLVNNEVGAVMPVEEIAKMVHEKSPKALYHVDAIQGFGKYRIYPKKMGIDLLAVSGHKIHGPKGIGFLYINEKVKIIPQILGGGQQSGMRSGTDNVPGIAGLGVAAAQIYENLDENVEHMYQLKEHIAEGLSEIEDIRINGMPLREGAPQILSISVMGVRSEVLLHALEDKGIYISAGSACSSHKRKPSATLSAMGMSKDQIESTVRLSFCEENTMEEADYFLQTMKELVPMLRRYSRK